jgi:hypothetical protein
VVNTGIDSTICRKIGGSIPRESSQTELLASGPETQSGKAKPAETAGTIAAKQLRLLSTEKTLTGMASCKRKKA